MKQIVIFWICFLCFYNGFGQEEFTYEVNSIFPRHLLENAERDERAIDSYGFFWNCSLLGLQCFDGEKLISYNDQYESRELSVSSIGHGYVAGIMVEGRYYWAIERKTSQLICFDTETRSIIKRFIPSEGKIYHSLQKDEHEKLFVIYTTKDHRDNRIYQIENLDTISQFHLPGTFHFHDYAIHSDHHWVRFQENIKVFDSLGKLKKKYPTEESACVYFSNGPETTLVLENACITEVSIYDPVSDSLLQMSIPSELTNIQHDVFYFGDHIWFVGQQVKAILWNRATNTLEDYSNLIIDHYKKKENSPPIERIRDVISDQKGGYYMFSREITMHLSPKKKRAEDYLVPIAVDKPTLSIRASAEDERGNLYTSFYTGVAIKKKGTEGFIDFRGVSSAPRVKEATYSLTVWKNKLIWNNIIFDLEIEKEDFIKTPDYGHHLNHKLMGDTLWTFWWLSNTLIKTDLLSGNSTVVNEKVFTSPLWVSTFEYDEVRKLFWISTGTNGILSFDKKGKVIDHYPKKVLGENAVQQMVHEMYRIDSLIWYGTNGSLGVLNLNSKKTKHYQKEFTKSNGNQSPRSIYAIFPKNDSILYLGTNKGLVKFDTRSRTMQALKSDHALAGLEFNRNALFQASNGQYYFGTIDGLYSFSDEDLVFTQDDTGTSPRIYQITIASNNSKEERVICSNLSNVYDLTLQADESFVTIDLTTPSYGYQAGYSYQFANVQRNWINTGSSITIPSLRPGKDTLRIKNAKDINETKSNFVQINIHKKQFWFKKNWVIGLFVLAFVGLVSMLQRWIYQQKLKREKDLASLRTKISSDLHDDVGSILSGLAMQSEMLTYQIEGDRKKDLNEISAMSRDAMDRMRDTVWTIDSRKDKYENLIDRMRSFAEKSLGRKGIEHHFTTKEIDGKKSISPTLRQNVYLIFKEAITNIVKHSNATKVEIVISKTGKSTLLSVSDNGTVQNKLSNHLSSDGQGLSNIQLRADRIKANLRIDKKDGFRISLLFTS